MDIVTALSAATQAVALVKQLRDIDQDVAIGTYKSQIADLYETLSDAKMGLVDAKEEISALEKEIFRLKKDFELKGQLKDNGLGFHRFVVDGKFKGYAVCPRCETVDARIIQLVRSSNEGPGRGATCPECQREYDSREAAGSVQ